MKKYLFFLTIGIILGLFLRDILGEQPASAKIVTVRSRNLEFRIESWEKDVQHGQTIEINKPVEVIIRDGGDARNVVSIAATVGDLIHKQQIDLAATDRVTPSFGTFLTEGMTIQIDRIVDLEVTEEKAISFEVVRQNDQTLYYGNEEVAAPGEEGLVRQRFLITYRNGVETARRLLEQEVLRDPVSRKVKFGTKIEIQEYGRGRGSWYAYQGCMCAAHPHYEFGRYVRVTREDTGQSVIVRINDRGPNQRIHPDRIIDLDSVAFTKLAPLGLGTIPVRVELLRR